MRLCRRPRPVICAVLALSVVPLNVVLLSPSASAATDYCGTFCSGADGTSGLNIANNKPQDYIGEVGTATYNWGGERGPCPTWWDGMCFNTAGANNAMTRRSHKTGLGVAFYYVANGPKSRWVPAGVDAYCWGWGQGEAAVAAIYNHFGGYMSTMYWTEVAIDIEGVNSYGWSQGNYYANRLTFNGCTDYLAGRQSTDSSCSGRNNTWWFQYMIYTNPYVWHTLVGTYTDIPNTPVTTPEPACYQDSEPSSLGPAETWKDFGSQDWLAYSNYFTNWQFWQTGCNGTLYDFDVATPYWYMPVFGRYMT